MNRLLHSMARFALPAIILCVAALGVSAQQSVQIRGRIVRTDADQIIVQTAANKQVTLYTNPQTKYIINNKAAMFTDLRTGADFTATYVTEGDRYIVNTFTVGAAAEPIDRPAQAKTTASGTVVEGEVVRVVGKDLVVIRNAEGKEVMIYVSPETRYQLGAKGGEFTDLKPGTTIGVDYEERDKRYTARQVVGVTRLEGQVVRVVDQNQVIVRTSDGKEVTVWVSPETRYQLTAQGGTFTDVRPGTDINVYYEMREQRPVARRIFPLRRNR